MSNPFVDLPMRARLDISKHREINGVMTCKDILIAKPGQILLPFATVELVEKDKPMLADRLGLSSCVTNSPQQQSSETTKAASISSERSFKPYWSVLCEEISSELLLPIGTDSPDSAERLYNSSSNKTVEQSWFSTKLYIVPNPDESGCKPNTLHRFMRGCSG